MKTVSLVSGRTALRFLPMLLVLTNALPCLHAQDFDEYKVVRIFGFWLYSNPGGSFTDATTGDVIDIKKDFNFGSYSTFTGKVDWKFTARTTSM